MRAEAVRNWMLSAAIALLTLVMALAALRWFAPGLLGLAPDLQLVRVSEKMPPFFDGLFRIEDLQSREFLLKDPVFRVRGKPLMERALEYGPHDVLGFRNLLVPSVTDVIAIGDSQTYGLNASMEQSWPKVLQQQLGDSREVYSMAMGGWGAVQYVAMFGNATVLRPRVVIIAFYSGNDPLDSFITAYGMERWADFRLDPDLEAGDAPDVVFHRDTEAEWQATFSDGHSVGFTPALRLAASSSEAAQVGWKIMRRGIELISEQGSQLGLPVICTIIPTKELVFSERVSRDGLDAPPVFHELTRAEKQHIDAFADAVGDLGYPVYVDLLGAMTEAVLDRNDIYSEDANGHPLAEGYAVIARTLTPAVEELLPNRPPEGVYRVQVPEASDYAVLVRGGEVWVMQARENAPDLDRLPVISQRDIAHMRFRGSLAAVQTYDE